MLALSLCCLPSDKLKDTGTALTKIQLRWEVPEKGNQEGNRCQDKSARVPRFLFRKKRKKVWEKERDGKLANVAMKEEREETQSKEEE